MSKEQFLAENLKDGELDAGIVNGENGKQDYRLILISISNERFGWEAAIAWAATQKGELPNQKEQMILYDNLKLKFGLNWYWSCEQVEKIISYAWADNFNNGCRDFFHKSLRFKACAIRRMPILD